MLRYIWLIGLCSFSITSAYSEPITPDKLSSVIGHKPDSLPRAELLTDTFGVFASDSFVHNLGSISQYDKRPLYKPLIYLGKDTMAFVRAFTSDPHFICQYPKGRIVPNQVFWIKICFYRQYRVGPSRKTMGLQTSTGERFQFRIIEMITEN